MKLTHIDCFSGTGGMCTGLHAAGFDTRIAIELVKCCADTYTANHPEVHVINADIRTVTAEQILPYVPEDGIDLVTAGMPCETFSTAGNSSRSFYDCRQTLFREGIRIAEITRAKMLLFENVPGIMSKRIAKQSETFVVDMIKEELRNSGYGNFIEIVLNSTQYGVPQKRNRYFILACKHPNWKLSHPEPTCTEDITVSEAFDGLPNVIPNSGIETSTYVKSVSKYAALMRDDVFWKRNDIECDTVTYQMPMKHRAYTLERFSMLQPGESLKNLFDRYTGEEREKLQERRVMPKKMFIKRNYRLKLDEAAPTVTSHCLDEFVHPIHNRALTVRECARLQSFPDSYDFAGGPYITPHIHKHIQDKYEQIGDAVPPLLAYAWGGKIAQILEDNLCQLSNSAVIYTQPLIQVSMTG